MAKKNLDYESIGRDYCAGVLSVREIGRKHGCTDGAIRKMAVREKWERALSEKVKERIKVKLVKADADDSRANRITLPPEHEIIEEAANVGVQVIQIHRAGIRRCRAAADTLLEQVRDAMGERGLLEEIIHDETNDDTAGKRRAFMMRAVSLPSHAGVVRDLSQVLKNLIPLERQAFNLNDKPADAYADLPRDEVERRLAELEKRR